MASRFWVLGTGVWDATTTTNWASTTGGAGGASVPGSADTVTFDTNSGTGTVTLSTSPTIVSLNFAKAGLTLAAGANTLTVNGTGTIWQYTAGTLSLASSTIVVSGATATFSGGSQSYGTVNLTGSGTTTVGGANTFVNLTRTSTVSTLDVVSFSNAAPQTITGTFTLTGNSVNNRLLVQSSTMGTARSSAVAAASLTNVDFQDITFTNTTSPGTNFTGTSLGDGGGNSGITLDTPVTQTWSGNTTGNWSNPALWTSRVPLPQDPVLINALTSGTVTADMPRLGASVDFTSSTGGTFGLTNKANTTYGGWTLVANVAVSGTQAQTFITHSGTATITSAGIALASSITFNSPGSTITFADAFSTSGNVTFNIGTLDTNNQTMSFGQFLSGSSGLTRVLTLGTSIINLTGNSANSWNLSNVVNFSTTASSSTINITNTNTGFVGANLAYGTLNISSATTGANSKIAGNNTFTTLSLSGGSTTLLPYLVTGSNTITTLSIAAAQAVQFTAGTTQTITNYSSSGTLGNLITLNTTGAAATLAFGSQVNVDYLSLTNLPAATTIPAYAGTNSTDGGGNTNWLFSAAPLVSSSGSTLMLMGV